MLVKEIRSLTGLRGLAALYIAFYHSLEIKNYHGNSLRQVFINHGPISVDLFFILSGFVMALSSKKMFEGKFSKAAFLLFMKKRFARIYPLYFTVTVLAFIFINHFGGKLNFIIGLTLLSVIFLLK